MLPARYGAMYDLLETSHLTGAEPWARLWREGHGAVWQSIRRFVEEHQPELLASLLR